MIAALRLVFLALAAAAPMDEATAAGASGPPGVSGPPGAAGATGSSAGSHPPRAKRTPEVVEVSATRLDADDDSSPVRVDRMDEVELRDAAGPSPSLAQAVQQLPGVGAIGRDGFTSAPTIRGLGRDRSLLLLEGMRLSSDRGVGPSGSFVDPFLLRSLDVVRGPSGVAYGSGAIGGVIRVGLGGVPEELGVSARLAGSSNGDGRLVAGRVEGMAALGWHGSLGGFFRSQDDYEFSGNGGLPGGPAPNSGFENGGGTVLAEREVARGTLRIAALATAADEVGRPTTQSGRLDTIETENHSLASVRWAREDEGIRAAGTARRLHPRTEAVVAFHRPRTVNRTERFDDSGARTRTGRTENESVDGSASILLERPFASGSWVGGIDAFSRLGVDAVETNVRYESEAELPPERVNLVRNAQRLDLGAFWAWKRPVKLLGELILAGRLDWSRRDADDRSSSSWVSPSLSAGVVYPLGTELLLTGAAGRSFRAPRLQELYFEGDRPGGSRLANPDLEPETAWSLETGLRWSTPSASAGLALWGIAADQLIVQLPVDAEGDTLRNENEASAILWGAELGFTWTDRAAARSMSLAYAFVHGEDDGGDPVPDVPSAELRVTGEARLFEGRDAREANVWLTMRAGAAKTPIAGGESEEWWSDLLGSTRVGGDELGHPGFARWDAGVRLRISEVAALDLSVSNLFDSSYRDRPEDDAFPQPGRAFLAELTVGR